MKRTTENIIDSAIEIHGNKYDYSLVTYTGSTNDINIICKEHGIFKQRYYNHLNGAGCPLCSTLNTANLLKGRLKRTTEEFIQELVLKHENKYDYSLVEYTGCVNFINVICPQHGQFSITAASHLAGSGCAICGSIVNGLNHRKDTNYFIDAAKKIHTNRYNYDIVNYINNKTKVIITCPEHGMFNQTPGAHLAGKGCPECGKYNVGWTYSNWEKRCENKIPKLYIIRFKDSIESFIKIGITSKKNVMQRFSSKQGYTLEIIDVTIGSPKYIWDLEHKLLKILKPYKYMPLKEFEGRHECVIDDVDLVINTLNNTK